MINCPLTELLETLRCPACHGRLLIKGQPDWEKGSLNCGDCHLEFPIVRGIPRLLLPPLREALLEGRSTRNNGSQQVRTALSFGFEWNQFPHMYEEWQESFLSYMRPHPPEFFSRKKVLDAGCGNGRFAYYAARYGAEVWALDLSSAVIVAQHNTKGLERTYVIQGDLHRPPFAFESFDFIYSIGVLHHLPDPEGAFRELLRFLKPGGEIQIYLYWKPENQPIKKALLTLISTVRQITTRLPHSVVHVLAFPASVIAFALFVWPYRILRRIPGLQQLAEALPMKQYSNLPFRVCVNDQLDRLSAPIENRYTRKEVEDWLTRAELENSKVFSNYGWVATGRKGTKMV